MGYGNFRQKRGGRVTVWVKHGSHQYADPRAALSLMPLRACSPAGFNPWLPRTSVDDDTTLGNRLVCGHGVALKLLRRIDTT